MIFFTRKSASNFAISAVTNILIFLIPDRFTRFVFFIKTSCVMLFTGLNTPEEYAGETSFCLLQTGFSSLPERSMFGHLARVVYICNTNFRIIWSRPGIQYLWWVVRHYPIQPHSSISMIVLKTFYIFISVNVIYSTA